MNPYLEQDDAWSDFHDRFIPAAAEALGPQVQPNYIVKINQHVFVQETDEEERRYLGRPDVSLAAEGQGADIIAGGTTVVAPSRAQIVTVPSAEQDPFIEIQDRESRKVVTVIELLSPSNKQLGSGRDQYLAKRNEYLKSAVHLVEIDLLRGGPRMPLAPQPAQDYCVIVSRAEDRPDVDVWPIRLRDSLPRIPIPLHLGRSDAQLDLKAVLDRVYDAAGYQHYLYRLEPNPPLSHADLRWAAAIIAQDRQLPT
jgi:hypothetical protein